MFDEYNEWECCKLEGEVSWYSVQVEAEAETEANAGTGKIKDSIPRIVEFILFLRCAAAMSVTFFSFDSQMKYF